MDSLFFFSQRARAGGNANRGRRFDSVQRIDLADCELAGARGLRHVRYSVRRTSGPEAHSDARRLEGFSAAQGLRHSSAGQRVGADQPRNRERTMNAPAKDGTKEISAAASSNVERNLEREDGEDNNSAQ